MQHSGIQPYTMYDNKTPILAQAKKLAEKNLSVFPLHGVNDAGYCRCGNVNCKDPGKHPDTPNGFKNAVSDISGISRIFASKTTNNIGVATGKPSSIIVVDIDDPAKFSEVEKTHDPIKTLTVKTSKGKHLYFKYRDDYANVKNSQRILNGSCDIRCDGGYVVAPGSKHQSGHVYEFDETYPIADLPTWIESELPRHVKPKPKNKNVSLGARATAETSNGFVLQDPVVSRISSYCKNVPPAIEGQGGRNETFKLCCYLHETFPDATNEQLIEGIDIWNQSCSPPWDEYGSDSLEEKLNEAREHVDSQRDDDVTDCSTTATNTETNTADDLASKPIPDPIIFTGILGDAVKLVEPYTEADPIAVFVSLLTLAGSIIDQASIDAGQEQRCNLFTCIIGASARARKGTSLYYAKQLLSEVNDKPQTLSGIGSGEGLVDAVKDIETKQNADGLYSVIDGTDDKRVIVEATEFGSILKVIKREGCTLSAIIRNAWDGDTIRSVTKGRKLVATKPHISIIAHVTTKELTTFFSKNDETTNGFANRFLWIYSERSKRLPLPPPIDSIEGIGAMRSRIASSIDKAKLIQSVKIDNDARKIYLSHYDDLTRERSGLHESTTTRAEAQVLRIALVLAVLEGMVSIDTRIIQQAISVWSYCDQSARYVFGDDEKEAALQNDVLAKITARPGQKKSKYRPNGHVSANDLDSILRQLVDADRIHEIDYRFYPGQGAKGKAGKDIEYEKKLAPLCPDDGANFHTVKHGEKEQKNVSCPVCPENEVEEQKEIPAPFAPCPVPRGKPATLTELFDYKNSHLEIRFVKNDDGVIILESKVPIPEPIRLAVAANQETVSAFVSDSKPKENSKEETLTELDNAPESDYQKKLNDMAGIPDPVYIGDEGLSEESFMQLLNQLAADASKKN